VDAPFHHARAEDAATLHILASPLLPPDLAARYLDIEGRTFAWQAMLDERGWSTSEETLLRAAVGVWNGLGDCMIGDLVSRLNDDDYRRVLEALAIRRGILLGLE
jgi:hypothetical protein